MFERMVDESADVVCTMVWKNIHGVTNARKLLTENGFAESISIGGYWDRVVSTPQGHACPICKASVQMRRRALYPFP